jgi:dipeptidyl aminopeptidase/acylaminoacyl peptidase
VISLERLVRPRLGLAGYRFDPTSMTSGVAPLVARIELLRVDPEGEVTHLEWRPERGALLDEVRFSPDGSMLSALVVSERPARIALFDTTRGHARVLDADVNAAWGNPCRWLEVDALLCRVVPRDAGPPPAARPEPSVIERFGEAAPTRTYSNLLETPDEEALFDHYFTVELAKLHTDGRVERLAVEPGLIERIEPSPDGALTVLTRIHRPFSHLVPASQFPSTVELWDLDSATRLYSSRPSGFEVEPPEGDREDPRRAVWRPGSPTTLGFIERTQQHGRFHQDRWLVLESPFAGEARELARSDRPIRSFGWTTAGTPYFTTAGEEASAIEVFLVLQDGPRSIWRGSTRDRYNDAGRALRIRGEESPVLEVDGQVFFAGDGLGPDGPRPFLDVLDVRSGTTERVFSAEPGVFESVLAVLDPDRLTLLTSRETEQDPPNLQLVRDGVRTPLRPLDSPYPDLDRVTRQRIDYARADGVALAASLYLPAGWQPGDAPLPTLVWIYPHEFSDRDHAEQLDVRTFQFHQVKGPSPLAALLAGYAVLVNPTVPILTEGGGATDQYLPQLVASVEAAVDHLVSSGVSDPDRIAVGGRSYGAFSAANLLVHSQRFATAIAMSGAYNRTLTPFGFQHEKRSFWEATELYTAISPFFHANEITQPILLVHGGADENPGTPTLQARRFLHALVGEGVPVRYVELPSEGHHYWARENVLHAAAEMIDWLDRTIGSGRAPHPATQVAPKPKGPSTLDPSKTREPQAPSRAERPVSRD